MRVRVRVLACEPAHSLCTARVPASAASHRVRAAANAQKRAAVLRAASHRRSSCSTYSARTMNVVHGPMEHRACSTLHGPCCMSRVACCAGCIGKNEALPSESGPSLRFNCTSVLNESSAQHSLTAPELEVLECADKFRQCCLHGLAALPLLHATDNMQRATCGRTAERNMSRPTAAPPKPNAQENLPREDCRARGCCPARGRPSWCAWRRVGSARAGAGLSVALIEGECGVEAQL